MDSEQRDTPIESERYTSVYISILAWCQKTLGLDIVCIIIWNNKSENRIVYWYLCAVTCSSHALLLLFVGGAVEVCISYIREVLLHVYVYCMLQEYQCLSRQRHSGLETF